MYGKLFGSLFTGSMRGKGDLQLTFAYMIANANADGVCDFTPQCIADATGKPLPLIEAALRELEAPDQMSRTRVDDGRRIRLIDAERPWGWQIVNHKLYRDIAGGEAMKEAERLRKREYRAKVHSESPGQVRDKSGHPVSVSDHVSASETPKGKRFEKPSPADVTAYALTIGYTLDGAAFCDHYEANGWMRGKTHMKDWQASVRTWKRNEALRNAPKGKPAEDAHRRAVEANNRAIERADAKA